MLINDRKFDMRLWVLISHDHRCYLFKEGYIRTSSYKYTLESEMIENLAVHLTNNAIQKQDEAYGKLEDGNQLSYAQATEITGVNFAELVMEKILPVIELSLVSARLKINKNNRRFCFEILGYDFMVD